jgi:excisionase family DNA binding protein
MHPSDTGKVTVWSRGSCGPSTFFSNTRWSYEALTLHNPTLSASSAPYGVINTPTTPFVHIPDAPILSIRDRIASFGKALNAEQLADILGMSEVTIYKHAKAGKIPSFRVGTCVRFCPKEVSEWISKQ